MTSLRTLVLVSFFSLPACGGGTSPPADAPPALDVPAVTDDAPVSTDDAPTATDGPSPCAYVDGIDRNCTTDADCSVVLHQTDCCGNSVMLGIATTAYPEYGANEPACMASYPACGCPAGLPTTDSGETVTDTSAVLAACVIRGPRNVCLTYVTMRPADGR